MESNRYLVGTMTEVLGILVQGLLLVKSDKAVIFESLGYFMVFRRKYKIFIYRD